MPRFFLFLLTALIFIWSMPGTIALRHVLIAAALGCAAFHARQAFKSGERWGLAPSGVAGVLGFYVLIMLWLIAQALWVSADPSWALREISGQWGSAGAVLLLGVAAGLLARRSSLAARELLTVVTLTLAAQALVSILASIPYFLDNGFFPPRQHGITAGQLEISFANGLLLALSFGELMLRVAVGRSVSLIPMPLLLVLPVLACVGNLLFGARVGMLIAALLVLAITLLTLHYARNRRVVWAGSAVLLLALAAVVVNVQRDPRWHAVTETIAMGWNIDAQKSWIDEPRNPLPRLSNGQLPEHSLFMRTGWIHAGLRLVAEQPLGVGFGRNAFGRALSARWETRLGHAHNGMIDLVVGAGVPGVVLWLAWMGALLVWSCRRLLREHDALGLLLGAVVLMVSTRLFFDSVGRDHMLQMFFFLIGLFAVLRMPPGDALDQSGRAR